MRPRSDLFSNVSNTAADFLCLAGPQNRDLGPDEHTIGVSGTSLLCAL